MHTHKTIHILVQGLGHNNTKYDEPTCRHKNVVVTTRWVTTFVLQTRRMVHAICDIKKVILGEEISSGRFKK